MGTIRSDEMDVKTMYDHLVSPPFGIRQDPDIITTNYVAGGSKDTSFSHVYLPLVVGPDRQRLVPAHDEGHGINKKADLDVDFKFTDATSPANTIFVIFAIYTDVNIIFDPIKRSFTSPYLQYMN
jgi:hypothetical protein